MSWKSGFSVNRTHDHVRPLVILCSPAILWSLAELSHVVIKPWLKTTTTTKKQLLLSGPVWWVRSQRMIHTFPRNRPIPVHIPKQILFHIVSLWSKSEVKFIFCVLHMCTCPGVLSYSSALHSPSNGCSSITWNIEDRLSVTYDSLPSSQQTL